VAFRFAFVTYNTKFKLVEKEAFPIKDHRTHPIQVEKRFGLERLAPWDDFEWGMLNC
jgi:hypothetical protein